MNTIIRLNRGNSVLIASMSIYVFAVAATAFGESLQQPEAGKTIKVFILAGQSNMEGRADGALLTPEDRLRLVEAQKRVQLAFNEEPIRRLDVVKPSEGIAKSYQRDLIFGPELFFGIALSEMLPNERILLIKRTQGGTSLYGCWNANWDAERAALMAEADEPKLYSELKDYIDEVLAGSEENDYEICAMLWVQGETDAENEIAAAAYGSNLAAFIERIRQDVSRDLLPFLLFQVGHGDVVKGMTRVSHEVPDVTLILQSQEPASPEFYQKMENGHYNYEGMKKLGQRFAEVYFGLR